MADWRKNAKILIGELGFFAALSAAICFWVYWPFFSELANGLHRIPPEQTSDMRSWFRDVYRIDAPRMQVLDAEQDSVFTGASSRWMELSIASADVDPFRRALTEQFNPSAPQVRRTIEPHTVEQCISITHESGVYSAFWKPEVLSDATVLCVGPYPYVIFIFSEKAGLFFCYLEGH